MKKIIEHSYISVMIIIIVCAVTILISLPTNAQVASSSTASYFETSASSPQRVSAFVNDDVISIHAHDENASNEVRVRVILRNMSDNNLCIEDGNFIDGESDVSLNMSGYNEARYYIGIWEQKPNGVYEYWTKMGLIYENGIYKFYAINGSGQQTFMEFVNGVCNPEDYRGFSYWAQTADNFDEIASTAREITLDCNSDEEKVRAIHDWICENFAYDFECYNNGNKQKAMTASWVYKNKRGICSGLARLANVMLTAVDIPRMDVNGWVVYIEEGVDYSEINHEWNLVFYNGSWHIFDITHDCLNEYYGEGHRDNKIGLEPSYKNYDIGVFASGVKYISHTLQDEYNRDDYGVNTLRVYNRYSGEHLYTTSYDEYRKLLNNGWYGEGVSWKSPLRSNVAVYRIYNPISGEHHYTMDYNEVVTLAFYGWNYEGVAWYSDDEGRVPVYRLFNPSATGVGAHHYTTDWNEAVFLAFCGWNYEGIGWYAV